ncbi:proton-conducting membrane transporter [Serratia plymuthica]|uniref:proton-conducting transporter transmembrane domain-containing protein n=1 Tax=Serratia plymuthica TaxID=82996 RepID=UPI0004565486|nr:proton-conducting transporter membrane subunit [Serratia plymuthica]AHY09227.1 NADH dehydrogenase [Serratia plymuthica]MBL3522597.1 proton-conducting membrane transporter [Serratia plymuthica]MEB6540864.1 proton-conducting membrane transporter [Serratia plymuthica]
MITDFLPDPLLLLTLSLSGSLLLAALCWLLAIWPRFCAGVCGIGTLLVSLAATAAALPWLFTTPHPARLPWLHYAVEISGLNALLLLVIALSNLFVGLYLCHWLTTLNDHNRTRQGSLMLLMPAALSAAVMADNALALVLLLELAALCGYFLIVRRQDAKSQQAGHSQFLLMRFGTLLLVAAFTLIYSQTHSLQFSTLREIALPSALRSGAFLLALAGFGIYAGVMPLHGWVPQAHSSAPAPAASLFSCALMKVGLLGVIKIGMDLLGTPPLWWGLLVLLLAAGTAFFGGLYALMEHDLRRLLAYHTLENIGIILLGIGGAMVGLALQLPELTALALMGGLFHLCNHSLFKSALLLASGAVEQQTGLKDMEKMGGLARLMPWTCIALLVGLVSMAALPPLNGFASEWLIYQGLFQFSATSAFVGRLLGPLLAVALAITGALAVMCVSKVFGVVCLGAPRCEAAANARPATWPMMLSHLLPALLCLLCGIGAPWLIPLFARLAATLTPQAPLGAHLLVSPPLIAILLLAMPLLPLLIAAVYRGKRQARRTGGEAWACGYGHEASMVITATGFAQPLRVMFAPLYALRQTLQPAALQRWLHRAPLNAFCRGVAAIELAVLLVVALA